MNSTKVAAFLLAITSMSCTTTPQPVVQENKNPKYEKLRQGIRYVIYVADNQNEHTEAAIELENRIKAHLADKGLVLVDFDQTSLANILRNNGKISDSQAKQVSSAADLVLTGRMRPESMKDPDINKGGVFRSRLRLSLAVTESNSAIERGRFQDECEAMASSHESALIHASIACGDKVAPQVVEKLLYIYGK